MKNLFLAALAVAILGAGSYLYFTQSKPINPPIPKFDTTLVGKWKMDTAYNKVDSTKLGLLIAYMFKDSASIQFNADSTLDVISNNVKEQQNYYINKDTLFVKNDSIYEAMTFKMYADSSFKLNCKDSTIVVYSKVK